MKIAVLGAGAMGSLFGSYLSKKNDVFLIDVNTALVKTIQEKGVLIREKDGNDYSFFPKASVDCPDIPVVDLVIVFVKAMYTISALESNKSIIGNDTYLMTLQNGAGHETKLLKFADRKHVIIGSTQHNSSVIEMGHINHGGCGPSSIGLLDGGSRVLSSIAANLTDCGFSCTTSDNVQKQIWKKLFTNSTASILTAILQVPLGFIGDDSYANFLMHKLAEEAVSVADALGLGFDLNEVIADVQKVCDNAPNGYTSIYADLRDGRRTEVDTISGSVVEAAKTLGVQVPFNEMAVSLVHAMEDKNNEVKGKK